ncbi:MAG: response regulator [Leptospiraceae bacterium]|nr:response regulator [Leptospiraceae bacterium]MCP5512401.1 response regulator [Leptospiraceae bacterium]
MKRYKVLYVEDDKPTIRLINFFLNKYNFIVENAVDGMEALRLVQNNFYDIIITDINLPKLNGLEFLEKAELNLSKSLTIVLTAAGDRHLINRAQNSKVKLYLLKPISPSKLIQKIAEALEVELETLGTETHNPFQFEIQRLRNALQINLSGIPSHLDPGELTLAIQKEEKVKKLPKTLRIQLETDTSFYQNIGKYIDLLLESVEGLFPNVIILSDYLDYFAKKELNGSKFLNQCKFERLKKE